MPPSASWKSRSIDRPLSGIFSENGTVRIGRLCAVGCRSCKDSRQDCRYEIGEENATPHFLPRCFFQKERHAALRRFPETGAGRAYSGGNASFREAHGRRRRRFRIGTPRCSRTLEGRTGAGRRFFRNARFSSSGWKRWCRFAEGGRRSCRLPMLDRRALRCGRSGKRPGRIGGCFPEPSDAAFENASAGEGVRLDFAGCGCGRALPAFLRYGRSGCVFRKAGIETERKMRDRTVRGAPVRLRRGFGRLRASGPWNEEERPSLRKTVSAPCLAAGFPTCGGRASCDEAAVRFVGRDYSSGRAGSSVSS